MFQTGRDIIILIIAEQQNILMISVELELLRPVLLEKGILANYHSERLKENTMSGFLKGSLLSRESRVCG